ncbi:MAG: GGDEF domain-containing protein [Sulfurimonas sp.]|jgi:diguanylate cyclase (GGDEF)-like protein|nr:GGDEF domain-containing protein [Sulfurimonadaceae bacterium]
MQKNDLKALAEEMYNNLLEQIDSSTDVDKNSIVEYLKDAIKVISSIQSSDIDSSKHAKEAYSNSYKEIAKQSLSSYEHTNESFTKLTELQKETLKVYEDQHIDMEKINTKLSEIQTHMSEEIKRANSVISTLNAKVEELEKTSNLDPLTKTFNRRALDSYLTNIFLNNIKHPLYIIMLDIDDFKAINDNYGHITGDKVLIYVASLLKKTLRDGDKIFRYGGEEFTITISRATDAQVESIAKRILKLIETSNLIYLGEKMQITASLGLTKLLSSDKKPEELLERADKALYSSKANGKNMLTKAFS